MERSAYRPVCRSIWPVTALLRCRWHPGSSKRQTALTNQTRRLRVPGRSVETRRRFQQFRGLLQDGGQTKEWDHSAAAGLFPFAPLARHASKEGWSQSRVISPPMSGSTWLSLPDVQSGCMEAKYFQLPKNTLGRPSLAGSEERLIRFQKAE